MAEFDSRMVTAKRIEFAVGNPTVAEAFGEAYTAIERLYKETYPGRTPVGNIQVRATGDEIILFFDLDEQTNPVVRKSSVAPLADDFILRDTKNIKTLSMRRTEVLGGLSG